MPRTAFKSVPLRAPEAPSQDDATPRAAIQAVVLVVLRGSCPVLGGCHAPRVSLTTEAIGRLSINEAVQPDALASHLVCGLMAVQRPGASPFTH